MASLTVWRFDSPGGAVGAAVRVEELAQEGAARLVDAATIEWAHGQSKPRMTRTRSRFAHGAMGKAFWRSVFDAMLAPAGSGGGRAKVPRTVRTERRGRRTC